MPSAPRARIGKRTANPTRMYNRRQQETTPERSQIIAQQSCDSCWAGEKINCIYSMNSCSFTITIKKAQGLTFKERQQTNRALTRASFVRLAFEYAPDINYSAHTKIIIGAMDKICQYCQALKFRNETIGMCCAYGKVVLAPLPIPPEPLKSFLAGESDDSKLFLRKTRKFNSCFQMTSFGATKICDLTSDGNNFVTTFKIQGQVYHKIGSLMPMPNDDPKVSPQLRNDNYQIVIKADKVPSGEHAGRLNAPTVDEVAVIMVGDPVNNRDLKIIRRDSTVMKSIKKLVQRTTTRID
ncbi:hypothetical protein AGLY_007444 [Aphis glycines]|uniref:Uncharacterized protein n=1 Tax=Aphis glycines TaxID=307491 RepID=A0A6G0TN99_APHGL|nr:hypothetical protein AGLY_007444 [Aphis glycines]